MKKVTDIFKFENLNSPHQLFKETHTDIFLLQYTHTRIYLINDHLTFIRLTNILCRIFFLRYFAYE